MEYPNAYERLRKAYPDVVQAYEKLGEAAKLAGPLSEREQRLVKVALTLGAGLEGGTHSHARRALEAGVSRDDLRHVAILGITTLGFPSAARGMTWINDMLEP
jgi:alkylhydroperoxidase/carboxymuconolactone decarboxylase family protein YurZ